MNKSIALQNAQSIDDVIKIFDNGGTSEHNCDELAAQYAVDAAKDNPCTEEINAQLSYLAIYVNFDFQKAVDIAENMINDDQENITVYCSSCDEEYQIPEDDLLCPICMNVIENC